MSEAHIPTSSMATQPPSWNVGMLKDHTFVILSRNLSIHNWFPNAIGYRAPALYVERLTH